jgi:cysteine desulfurase
LTASNRLYLDHAATTPVLPPAAAAVARAMTGWANPSSPHSDGRAARAALEQARGAIAAALGWKHDILFTSGATEAIAIAGTRAVPQRRLFAATEHDAVPAGLGPDAEEIPVGSDGVVRMDALEKALAGTPALVAVQHVNNETGVVQPLERIADCVRAAGSLLLADCAQSAGKLPVPDADLVAISAHKFGGPPGVGALLVRDLGALRAGGGQERGYRRGTENLPAIAGMAEALASGAFAEAMPRLAKLRGQLEAEIGTSGGIVIGAESERSPAIGALAMPGVPSAAQLVQFDLAGISVSAGSACSSGSLKPSRVLAAMGVPAELAQSAVRVSFGPSTDSDDVARFVEQWRAMRARSAARAA